MASLSTTPSLDPPALSDDSILELVFNDGQSLGQFQPADASSVIEIDPQLLAHLKEIEAMGIQYSEQDKLQEAIKLFSDAIEKCPVYASAYNNRAQAYRILGEQTKALADLEQAIAYGKDEPAILRQAYTQRAIIKRNQGDKDGALSDFEKGAKFGNPIARALAVNENPYSKLCNATLLEVMQRDFKQP